MLSVQPYARMVSPVRLTESQRSSMTLSLWLSSSATVCLCTELRPHCIASIEALNCSMSATPSMFVKCLSVSLYPPWSSGFSHGMSFCLSLCLFYSGPLFSKSTCTSTYSRHRLLTIWVDQETASPPRCLQTSFYRILSNQQC